jgi:uncharacterized membrane protein
MESWLKNYRLYLYNKKFLITAGVAFLFLIAGIVTTYFAIVYATERASNSVTDIILSNVRVFDVDGIFLYGPVIYWVIIIAYVFYNPKKLPFTFKSIAVFLFIRSLFISLTHIGPFPAHAQISSVTGILGVFANGNDLFFSGHTGMPFLMALVFWDNKYIRFFSLIASLGFGAVVLLGHLHYSIDVFAAFFITYGIFHISLKLFKKDRQIFINGLEN